MLRCRDGSSTRWRPSGQRGPVALAGALAALAAGPVSTSSADTVYAGPAGNEGQVIVARVSEDRKAVTRLAVSYVIHCSYGDRLTEVFHQFSRAALRGGRFTIRHPISAGGPFDVTVRGRLTTQGLLGTIDVIYDDVLAASWRMQHALGSADARPCRSGVDRFRATRRYRGGLMAGFGNSWPFAVRVVAEPRRVERLMFTQDMLCGGQLGGVVSTYDLRGLSVRQGGFARTSVDPLNLRDVPEGTTITTTIEGRVAPSGVVSGTVTGSALTAAGERLCGPERSPFTTWR